MLEEHMWKVDLSLSSAAVAASAVATPTSVPGAGFSLLDLLMEILMRLRMINVSSSVTTSRCGRHASYICNDFMHKHRQPYEHIARFELDAVETTTEYTTLTRPWHCFQMIVTYAMLPTISRRDTTWYCSLSDAMGG
jgi:hypothetical protein